MNKPSVFRFTKANQVNKGYHSDRGKSSILKRMNLMSSYAPQRMMKETTVLKTFQIKKDSAKGDYYNCLAFILDQGNITDFESKLEEFKVQVNTVVQNEETLLHSAVRNRNLTGVKFLIRKGIDVDKKNVIL